MRYATIAAIGACISLSALGGVRPVAAQPSRFTTGREILRLDFAGTAVGDFPSAIKQLTGTLDVVDIGGVHMLRASSISLVRVPLPEVLPQDFTLEIDLVPKASGGDDLAVEGLPDGTRGPASAQVTWHRERIAVIGGANDMYQSEMPQALQVSTPSTLTHIVITGENETMQLFTNGRRLFTLTQRKFARTKVLWLYLGGEDDGPNAVYLARLRVVDNTLMSPNVVSNLPAQCQGVPGATLGSPLCNSLSNPGNTGTNTTTNTTATTGTNPGNNTTGGGVAGPTDTQAQAQAYYIILTWPPVPNATSYQVFRKETNLPNPAQVPPYLTMIPVSSSDLTGVDPYVIPGFSMTYWVRAVFADGSLSLPGPTATTATPASAFQAQPIANLRVSATATQSLNALGGAAGSTVTWTWDVTQGQIGFGVGVDMLAGATVNKTTRAYVSLGTAAFPTTGSTPPTTASYTMAVPQGRTIWFCVAPFPFDDPRILDFLPATTGAPGPYNKAAYACYLTQVP